MKIRILVLTLISALALGTSLPAAEKSSHEETELAQKMEKISGAWRRAKRTMGDSAKNADTLKDLELIRTGLTDSLKLKPEITATKPAADQAKFVADYQAKLKEQITKVEKVIGLVKAGKNDEAAKLVPEVDQMTKDSHSQFKKQKKKS